MKTKELQNAIKYKEPLCVPSCLRAFVVQKLKAIRFSLLIIAFSFLKITASAEVKLPALIRDSMVLQREAGINIWGWASAGEKIEIKFLNKTYKTTTGSNGKWKLRLNPVKAGGPYIMNINGTNKITIKNILIGDVWFCSGQSNMVHTLSLHKERYEDDIEKADYPQIRQFYVAVQTDLVQPLEDIPAAHWQSVNPNEVLQFSVVAYYFAKAVHEKIKVPIGIIVSAVGGPGIEAWMSVESLKDFSSFINTIKKNKDTVSFNSYNRSIREKNKNIKPPVDKGLAEKWFDVNHTSTGWKIITVPGYWEDQGLRNLNGIVWYKKEFQWNATMNNSAKLSLGRIVDADEVYVNGTLIGRTYYQYPQRRYSIPSDILKQGANNITIKVINYSGKGGFVPDKPYQITKIDDTIHLKGDWQYKVGGVFTPEHIQQQEVLPEYQPAAVFNGIIAPLTDYSIKGFLWYQGEGNLADPKDYEQLLTSLIKDWREKWNQPQAPFLFVQLPNYGDVDYSPVESNWAALRQAQLNNLSLPNTAMAVAIDLGEWNDIHPWNKKDIGLRLASAALHTVYGEKVIVPTGPLIKDTKSDYDNIILSFTNSGSGLISKDGEALRWFAIAGRDKKYKWAKTKIEKNNIIVWHNDISEPMYVRYAWSDNPQDVNFYNKEGLPASPFEISITSNKSNTANSWNGKKAAVVLTYDDALNDHLTNAIPALDSLGLKGTFYISDYFGGLNEQLPGWKKAAANGHELGNHTIFHPCTGGLPGREFVSKDYDLNNYSIRRITDEIKAMQTLLKSIDGKDRRTFAYTCGDMKIRDSFFFDGLKDQFAGARAVRSEMITSKNIDLYNLPSYSVNGETGEELINMVKKAINDKAALVLLFHGVGGEHGLNVSLDAHRQLLQYLKQNEKDIWIAPMVEVAEFIKSNQKK